MIYFTSNNNGICIDWEDWTEVYQSPDSGYTLEVQATGTDNDGNEYTAIGYISDEQLFDIDESTIEKI